MKAHVALGVVGALIALAAFPAAAGAHGPVAPVASSYLARVTAVPAGLDAKAIDGDQRMWLRVPAGETVVVLDYQGAPYLRFSPAGVTLNRNSTMYYLNQTPVAATPPSDLTARTPPSWHRVSAAHDYGWHDGRLHALATVALSPGAAFVGRWKVPLLVDGRVTEVSGGLWHADNPSIVWFWPIAVMLLCVLAAWRVGRPNLDAAVARVIALILLVATAVATLGQGLRGRPSVGAWQLIEMGIILAFVAWALRGVLFRRAGFFSYFVIAFVALWQGVQLIPALLHGFVLIPLPAFVARAAAVVCLGGGVGLLLFVLRLSGAPQRRQSQGRGAVDERSTVAT